MTATVALLVFEFPSFDVKHTQNISNNTQTNFITMLIDTTGCGFFEYFHDKMLFQCECWLIIFKWLVAQYYIMGCMSQSMISLANCHSSLRGLLQSFIRFSKKKNLIQLVKVMNCGMSKTTHMKMIWLDKITYLHKVGVLGIPDSHHSMHFLYQLLFLIIIKLHIPFGQSRLSSSVLDQDETDLKWCNNKKD